MEGQDTRTVIESLLEQVKKHSLFLVGQKSFCLSKSHFAHPSSLESSDDGRLDITTPR